MSGRMGVANTIRLYGKGDGVIPGRLAVHYLLQEQATGKQGDGATIANRPELLVVVENARGTIQYAIVDHEISSDRNVACFANEMGDRCFRTQTHHVIPANSFTQEPVKLLLCNSASPIDTGKIHVLNPEPVVSGKVTQPYILSRNIEFNT